MLVQVMAQRVLADAMELMANAMAQEARRGGEDELRLERFMNNKP
ncbi:hypothetical protein A2U01_0114633, partial [Trifolium medium]|nr:hypothetical protein [Trifolium medium]